MTTAVPEKRKKQEDILRKVVLIIEDSKAFANSLKGVIASVREFEVLIAHDFASAIDILSSRSEDIFVSVTDLNLPDAEDGAAVKLVRSYGIPCVVFTGSFSNALREDVLAMGVCDYVLKQGMHDLAYVARLVERLYENPNNKILLVEDAISSRELITDLLKRQRYAIESVDSAEAALKRVEEESDFKLVIIDSILEGMNGFELLKQLRMKFDATEMAIIGISGKASHEEIAKFIKYGANDFLAKPFEQEEFFCRINNSIDMMSQLMTQRALLNQKNELLGMAAHDIRNPLGNIISGVTLAAKKNTDPAGKRVLELVHESALHMKNLLDSLLDINAFEQSSVLMNLQDIDMREPLRQTLKAFQVLADDKSQTFMVDLSAKPLRISADELRLRELMSNLLSNAIKYAPKRGEIKISLFDNGQQAVLRVEDNGPGIQIEQQPLLFKPFSKLGTVPTGGESSIGLGLAICKKIADLHNASLKYETREEGGSAFELSFSLINGQAVSD
jgi:signal transduction histidine kinase